MSNEMDNVKAWKDVEARGDETNHPSGEINVSVRNRIGARVSALSGFAIATLAVSTVLEHAATTSSKA